MSRLDIDTGITVACLRSFSCFFSRFFQLKNVQFYSQRYLNGIQNEIIFLKQVKYVLISFLLS